MMILNADLGEGGPHDAELMAIIDVANVCCGVHAGDVGTSRASLELAKVHAVAINAHPGFDDRESMGRRSLDVTPRDVGTLLLSQLGSLEGLARGVGVRITNVKPHGALYHQVMTDSALSTSVVAVAMLFGYGVVGLPGSKLEVAASRIGVEFVAEGFIDRRYRSDGTLVPRSEANAIVTDADEAYQQVKQLIEQGRVQTLCVHGDTPNALELAKRVRECLASQESGR